MLSSRVTGKFSHKWLFLICQFPFKFMDMICLMNVLLSVKGYPVMIKASAGGGGKGLRIAWNDKEARLVGLNSCTSMEWDNVSWLMYYHCQNRILNLHCLL